MGSLETVAVNGPEMIDGERERIVAAIAKVAGEQGYAGLTIERIARYASVSEDVYEAHFSSCEQGLLAAQELFLESLLSEAANACDKAESFPLRVRAGIRAVLSAISEASALSRVFAVEAGGANLVLAERQFATLDGFARMLRAGRDHCPVATPPPASTERLLVGGIASVVSECLLMEEPAAILGLETDLVELSLTPFLGGVEARRIADA
jgi:AcrR family transcriptional regulator